MSAVAESFRFGRQHAQFAARLKALRRSEYDFLLGRCIDRATLARAEAIASRWRVHPHQVLIANGWLDAEVYYRALAHSCGAPFKAKLPAAEAAPAAAATPRQSLASGLLKERARAKGFILAPDRLRPNALREMLARLSPYHVSLASPSTVRGAICRHFAPTLARHAVEGLVLRRPEQSARTRIAFWQRLAFCFTTLALLAALALAPAATLWVVTAGLALLFVPLIGFRLLAAHGLLVSLGDDDRSRQPRASDRELPIYTLLVPLYREAHMLPQLVRALSRLDYPAAKLDIKIILEVSDHETIMAAWRLRLPGSFELVIVPELAPRTKPKALNYTLPLARGDMSRSTMPRTGLSPASSARRSMPSASVLPTSPQCRRGSGSTTRWTISSPGSSPWNIARCSMGCCRRSIGSSCQSRSAEPPTISAPRR